METTQNFWMIVRVIGVSGMWLGITMFAAKTLWNFGVPYAMIREALRHPEHKHAWSLFILLDLGLLMLAILGSAFAGNLATIHLKSLVFYGFGAIAGSYLHLFSILLLGGYFLGLFSREDSK